MVGEQRHVEVDAVAPDGRHLERDCGDEAQRARAVWESADGARAAFDLAMYALEPVCRADTRPVLLGKRVVRRRVGEAAFEALDGLRALLRELQPELPQVPLRLVV